MNVPYRRGLAAVGSVLALGLAFLAGPAIATRYVSLDAPEVLVVTKGGEPIAEIRAINGRTTTTQKPAQPAPAQPKTSTLYVNPEAQVNKHLQECPQCKQIAEQPQATWLGGWSDAAADVRRITEDAASKKQTPVFATYNIPNRDNGGYSAGGAGSPAAYRAWVDGLASNTRTPSIYVIEPDAITHGADDTRAELIRYAVNRLSATGSRTYIDAGHPRWLSPEDAAHRLHAAGVGKATGLALNTSNFVGTAENAEYCRVVVAKLQQLGDHGKRCVIDTSRNGNGTNGEWCNPKGRKLGEKPRISTDGAVDGYLWTKSPGESDGTCNGGPAAGQWWTEYAKSLL